MSYAVVGHCEWVTFARVSQLPQSGEIVTASSSWQEAAGGGAVAAVQLKRLAGAAWFFTSLGEDPIGTEALAALGRLGVTVHAARWPGPQTTGFVHVADDHERTITVIGRGPKPQASDPLPWASLAAAKGVYFVKGDPAALKLARKAKVVVATARILPTLIEAGIELDALVHSAADAGERYQPGDLSPAPKLVVATEGAAGGRWTLASGETGRFSAAPLTGPIVDAYGAGDSFAAGLTFGLGEGLPLTKALEVAASCGAAALLRRGAHGGQGSGTFGGAL